ncbi:hypothetical protein OHB39_38600 [Streptomyces sp. NBC_00047]|uniref:hypothetical protein n=1 Tax=Streptomyces sp. NBC_00047 TaxID=2975627 RepID=UPI0022533BB6|nr:hypothetical protein [Streptomyces sp. NBC_00047]MCX5613377.1 hypothetical protein [Streptomyces sp. NBC_00047]
MADDQNRADRPGRRRRLRRQLHLAYGVGLALIFDEAAALISLEDVYWDTLGGVSISLSVPVSAALGSILAFTRGRRP